MTVSPLIFLAGFALGTAIACLVAFFLNRFDVFNAKVLGSVVSIIAGGVVTAFLSEGKQFAWAGYCCGLGVVLILFVGSGKLAISRGGAMNDPRLKMLDELQERRSHYAIDNDEYKATKEAILAEIKKNPAISEPGRDQG